MCTENQMKLCCRIECETCYSRSFAVHKKAKYWSKKNDKKPHEIRIGSHKKYWFECSACYHQFEVMLNDITCNNRFCPYCSNKKLCDNEKCESCCNKSLATSERIKNWNYEKNRLAPRQIFKNSNLECWFECKICKHNYMQIPAKIEICGCPYCSNRKLCNNENCQFCCNQSFASSERAKNWNYKKNKLIPRQVFKNSNLKYWFECDICKHEFEKELGHISNSFCPYCAHQKLCNNENCQSCYNNSFASCIKSEYWNYDKNKFTPREVFKYSNLKYWFKCNKCKFEFESALCGISRNSWCPKCKNKTEQILHDWLLKHFKSQEIKIHEKFIWCKNDKTDRFLPFDFVIDHLKIIIELDGEQHFSQISNWESPEENLKHDKYKMECANKNGYSVIRVLQMDVYNDKYNWKEQLIKLLVKHDESKNFYIASQMEKYDKHR